MGNCAELFYSTNADLQTLHRRVRPSDEQLESQQTYWNDLADYLKDELAAQTSVTVNHWLQGSYKFGTQIRPAAKGQHFDIDLGVNAAENLNRMDEAYDGFVDDLEALGEIGRGALARKTQREAAETWADAFKHFFPLPDELTVLAEASQVEIAKGEIIVPEVRVEVTMPGGALTSTRMAH